MSFPEVKVFGEYLSEEQIHSELDFFENGVSDYQKWLSELIELKQKNAGEIAYKNYFEGLIQRSKKGDYHAVLGVSGGADSSMLACICKDYGLKILLVHMDNHWNTGVAENNLSELQKFTGYEFVRRPLDKDSFFDLQVAFLKSSTSDLENPTDIAILGVLSEIANKYKIKNILLATNFENEGFVPKGWHYDCRDQKYLLSIHKLFGKKPLKNFPFYDYKKEISDKIFKNIRFFYPLNVVLYDKAEAKHVLMKKMNWMDYKENHHESTYTAFVQKYVLPEKFGLDYRKIFLTAQMCKGKISRDEALKVLHTKPYNPETIEFEKKGIAEKLGIKAEDLNKWLSLPNKKYSDYPNDEKKIRALYKLYYLLYNKKPYPFYG
jgi:hypothetical protein